MKIAVTGGTGFVGRHIARALAAEGNQIVLLARGYDWTEPEIRHAPNTVFHRVGLNKPDALARAFAGCAAVIHCAGINREWRDQSYEGVHVKGTRHVVRAAERAKVKKIVLLSFLRARPNRGSAYHESKWATDTIR